MFVSRSLVLIMLFPATEIFGFVTLRHNEMRDLTADLLSTVCKDVCKEPCLQQSENGVEIRVDVTARGFWQRMQRAFVDVRVFYPFVPSYRCKTLASTFRSMELAKKGKYNEVVMNKENGTFTPLIFSCNGGMSIETRNFFQRFSELISEKHHQNFSDASAWIKRKLNFCLLRTAVVCIRGSRSRQHVVPIGEMSDLNTRNDLSSIVN